MRDHDQLERRLRSRGLCLIEPDDQDGRLCQYLAITHHSSSSTTLQQCKQPAAQLSALESQMLE